MSKKVLIKIIVVVVAALIVGGGVVLGLRYRARFSPAPIAIKMTPTPVKMITWDDPAGFTFQYPEGVSVDKHDEDKDNYAHIEMTQVGHPGNVIVWVKDTTAADVTAWVRTEKKFKDANVLDTTLAGKDAKKILLTSPKNMIIVGIVDDGLLFTVEASLEDDTYWRGIHQAVVDSFAFKPAEKSMGTTDEGTSDTSGEESVDEEEIVQ